MCISTSVEAYSIFFGTKASLKIRSDNFSKSSLYGRSDAITFANLFFDITKKGATVSANKLQFTLKTIRKSVGVSNCANRRGNSNP